MSRAPSLDAPGPLEESRRGQRAGTTRARAPSLQCLACLSQTEIAMYQRGTCGVAACGNPSTNAAGIGSDDGNSRQIGTSAGHATADVPLMSLAKPPLAPIGSK
jgi:hypothetical protein